MRRMAHIPETCRRRFDERRLTITDADLDEGLDISVASVAAIAVSNRMAS